MACSVRSSSCSGPDDATAPAIAKFVRGVLSVVVIVGIALSGQVVEAADNSVLKRFLSGIGQDAVGIVDASEDTEIAGPQAIYAGEGDEVYLLDQVNGRVLGFNPKKSDEATRSFRLPTELQPTDLIVRRGQIMVWDGDIHVLRPTGAEDAPTRGLEIISTRAVDDPFTVSEFAQMGSQKPEADGDPNQTTRSLTSRTPPQGPTRQYINSRVRGQIVATVSLDKGGAGAQIELEPRGQAGKLPKLQVKVRDRLGALEVLEVDRQGRIFVLGENVPMSGDLPSDGCARRCLRSAVISERHAVAAFRDRVGNRRCLLSAHSEGVGRCAWRRLPAVADQDYRRPHPARFRRRRAPEKGKGPDRRGGPVDAAARGRHGICVRGHSMDPLAERLRT